MTSQKSFNTLRTLNMGQKCPTLVHWLLQTLKRALSITTATLKFLKYGQLLINLTPSQVVSKRKMLACFYNILVCNKNKQQENLQRGHFSLSPLLCKIDKKKFALQYAEALQHIQC